jgi:hypothetical protein
MLQAPVMAGVLMSVQAILALAYLLNRGVLRPR